MPVPVPRLTEPPPSRPGPAWARRGSQSAGTDFKAFVAELSEAPRHSSRRGFESHRQPRAGPGRVRIVDCRRYFRQILGGFPQARPSVAGMPVPVPRLTEPPRHPPYNG